METNYITYDIDKSAQRIDDILNTNNSNFSDADEIPSRDRLTYTNGFYVNITSLFIDIVDSSDMTDSHKRPTLAKMYRAFLSECVAIMNGCLICKEISINGDCVWGVFETPLKTDIDTTFSVAAKLNTLVKILNYKLRKKGYSEIKVGIGMDYGRALMVKAGYSGSGINDVIWMGDVVNSACHICNKAGRNGRKTLMVSSTIYSNLNENHKKLLNGVYVDWIQYYEGDIINIAMNNWYNEHCGQ